MQGIGASASGADGEILNTRNRILLAIAALFYIFSFSSLHKGFDSGGAAAWFPPLVLIAFGSCLLLLTCSQMTATPSRMNSWFVAVVAPLIATAYALQRAVWEFDSSLVVWIAAGGFLLTTVLAVITGNAIVSRKPRTHVRSARDRLRSETQLDIRRLFKGLPHWQPPKDDDNPSPHSIREINEFEVMAFDAAAVQLGRQRRWQAAQYVIGLPAALFAGLAGATGISDISGGLKTALGILGLVGAALTSVATSLNAGRKGEEAATLRARYQALALEAHVYRAKPPSDETQQLAYLGTILQRFNVLSGSPATLIDNSDGNPPPGNPPPGNPPPGNPPPGNPPPGNALPRNEPPAVE
jgi:hypothetical protein